MTKKPPKPADLTSAPRFKAPRKDFDMANESIKDALRKISDAVMSEEDYEKYVQESSHAAVPVRFEYPAIANACAAIKVPTRLTDFHGKTRGRAHF
jgi:hypothetical protein